MKLQKIIKKYEKRIRIIATFNKLRFRDYTKNELLKFFPLSKESLKRYIGDLSKENCLKKQSFADTKNGTQKKSYKLVATELLVKRMEYIGSLTVRFVLEEFRDLFIGALKKLYPSVSIRQIEECVDMLDIIYGASNNHSAKE